MHVQPLLKVVPNARLYVNGIWLFCIVFFFTFLELILGNLIVFILFLIENDMKSAVQIFWIFTRYFYFLFIAWQNMHHKSKQLNIFDGR